VPAPRLRHRPPAHELPDRQCIEEFIGDEQHRARRQFARIVEPDRCRIKEPPLLLGAQQRARLDEVETQSPAKLRHRAGGAQQVGGEGAAAGTEFGEDHRVGPADHLPHARAPQPDQLAENLAHFGRSNKIAGRPDRRPACVVAILRIVQRHRHKGGDRERTLGGDPAGNPAAELGAHQRAAAGRCRAQRMMAIPAISNGTDSNWPMVVPKNR
jgi:hypothetical protein